MLVEEFECHWDKAEEDIDEGGVHVDDVIFRFEENSVRYFCSRTIVVVVADTEIGYFINFGRDRIVVGRIRFTGGVVCVQAGVLHDI